MLEAHTETSSQNIPGLSRRAFPSTLIEGLIAYLKDPTRQYLFVVVDRPSVFISAVPHHFWSYLADVVIRIDYGCGNDNYFAGMRIPSSRFTMNLKPPSLCLPNGD
jgi:hypothetical protein